MRVLGSFREIVGSNPTAPTSLLHDGTYAQPGKALALGARNRRFESARPNQLSRGERMEQTLLLNATYEPLTIVDWQRAITLWCSGKVEIIAEHDREVRAVTFTFKLPSVVRLLRFVRVRGRDHVVPFTRASIYRRDGYKCQYCGDAFASEDLTFDHVVPASHGRPTGLDQHRHGVRAVQQTERRAHAAGGEHGAAALTTQARGVASLPRLARDPAVAGELAGLPVLERGARDVADAVIAAG